MNVNQYKKNILFLAMQTILLFSISTPLLAQQDSKRDLYFYGTDTDLADDSVAKMSTDLYYSQFQINNDFTVFDRRTRSYSDPESQRFVGSSALVFYTELIEQDGKWTSVLYLVDFSTNSEVSSSYIYEEDYKVLLDAKKNLSELIAKLDSTKSGSSPIATNPQGTNQIGDVNISNLFGTWKGEEFVEKVVILRGGRGFVIFENGASMNVIITLEGEQLIALQESKSNASFFPELPREVALVKALEVNPIRWELTIENENLLTGFKHTYVAVYDDEGNMNVIEGEIPVRWQR